MQWMFEGSRISHISRLSDCLEIGDKYFTKWNAETERFSSLEEMCLSVIVRNFDRFVAAFKSRKVSVPRDHFEFLARKYSELLFCKLKDELLLRTGHLDFLINPHIKKLDVTGIDKKTLPHLIKRLKTHGSKVLSLRAKVSDFGKNMCKGLMSSLPNVENIYFDCSDTSDAAWKEGVKKCPHLKILMLEDIPIFFTEKDYVSLSSVIRHCPHLETFDYNDTIRVLYKMHKKDLQKSSKYVLRTLSSARQANSWSLKERSFDLSSALEVCGALCPYVTCLYIDDLRSDEELEKCSRFRFLEDVVFFKVSRITKDCFSQFLGLSGSKLTNMYMPYQSYLSVPTLMESCPNLRLLKLHYVKFHTPGVNSELSCKISAPHLLIFGFDYADFTEQSVTDIVKLILSVAKNIQKLCLTDSFGLSNEVVSSLALHNIRELDVSYSDIQMHPLKEILLQGNLQVLDIRGCGFITDDDYFTLTRCRSGDDQSNTVDIKRCGQIPVSFISG